MQQRSATHNVTITTDAPQLSKVSFLCWRSCFCTFITFFFFKMLIFQSCAHIMIYLEILNFVRLSQNILNSHEKKTMY